MREHHFPLRKRVSKCSYCFPSVLLELPSKSGDDVKETWKTSTAPDDCPEKSFSPPLEDKTDPSLNSDGVRASGLPAVTSRSSWVLYSEERTFHTLSALRDDTPVPCRDVPALNVENGESQYQDDALFKPPYTNAIPKPSESILSVTSNQQSTTHPGPITQEVAQSPLSNPLWNRDSKLNMAPPQCSDEEIHSGQEWEESGKYSDANESTIIFISPCRKNHLYADENNYSVLKNSCCRP